MTKSLWFRAMPHLVLDGCTFPLASDEVVLGRHPGESMFAVVAEGVSRRHARLYLVDGVWMVEDLESSNGTRVNGDEIFTPRRLAPGDVISVGKARIWFMAEDLEAADPTPTGSPVLGGNHSNDTKDTASAVAAVANDPLIGRTLSGCTIQARIGSGAMATVYRGELVSTGRTVAIRVFHRDLSERDPQFLGRMLEAIRASGRFTHPSAVAIFDCGDVDGRPWYAMELVEGESLSARIARTGPCEAPRAIELVWQAAVVLAAAHAAGLTHLAISPSCLLMDATGRLRITELGLGLALVGALDLNYPTASPRFAAPERLAGEPGTARSDIYSLGCILYFLLTGRAPDGEAVPTVCDQAPTLPKKIDEILGGALARTPTWRYVTMDEMAVELDKIRALFSGTQPARVPVTRPAGAPAPRPGSFPTPRPGSFPTPRPDGPIAPRAVGTTAGGHLARRAEERRNSQIKGAILLVLVVIGGWMAWQFASKRHDVVEQKALAHLRPQSTERTGGDWDAIANASSEIVPTDPFSAGTEVDPSLDADELRREWTELCTQVDTSGEAGEWAEAERQIKRFTTTLPAAAPASIVSAVKTLTKQSEARAAAWFAQQKQRLPTPPLERWAALAHLKNQAPAAHQAEVATLIRDAQTGIQEAMATQRATARTMLEDGRFDELTAMAKACAGYPQTAEVQALRLLTEEAPRIKMRWADTWAATRDAALATPTGMPAGDALALGAALILTNANPKRKPYWPPSPTAPLKPSDGTGSAGCSSPTSPSPGSRRSRRWTSYKGNRAWCPVRSPAKLVPPAAWLAPPCWPAAPGRSRSPSPPSRWRTRPPSWRWVLPAPTANPACSSASAPRVVPPSW